MERLTEILKSGNYVPKAPLYTMCDKLGAYEDLEEQGKLLKLPCAVGDTVYRIKSRYTKCSVHNEKIDECIYKGCGAECDSRKEYFVDEKVVQNVGQIVNTMQTGNFGKAVFLTREEAEAVLERREANETD